MDAARKNLKLLWWLRNLAIFAEAAAILIVQSHLKLFLPYNYLWMIIAAISLINVTTYFRLFLKPIITGTEFFCQLLADIIALALLLHFTGAAANPFANLFVLQVMIAATILSPVFSWAIAFITIAIYTLLLSETHGMAGMMNNDFQTHIRGMWVNFIILVILINWFVTRMNMTLRQKENVLAENEKMASLASLAINAAHQLGTPLGSISLLGESLNEKEPAKALLISEQISRCKKIISEITKLSGAAQAESGKAILLSQFIKAVLAEWKKPVKEFKDLTIYNELEIRIFSDQGLKTAISNILDNAYDASPNYIEFHCYVNHNKLHVLIRDVGKGFDTTSFGTSTKPSGLGMGLYLSQSIIARLGGQFKIESGISGTQVKMVVPLERMKI